MLLRGVNVEGGLQQLLHTFFIDSNLKLDLLASFFNYAVIYGRTAGR